MSAALIETFLVVFAMRILNGPIPANIFRTVSPLLFEVMSEGVSKLLFFIYIVRISLRMRVFPKTCQGPIAQLGRAADS